MRHGLSQPAFGLICLAAFPISTLAFSSDDGASGNVATAEPFEVEVSTNVGTQPTPPRKPVRAPQGETAAPASRWHTTLGVDYTTAYFGRGILCEDSGLILQPYADFAFDCCSSEDQTFSITFGTWNSYHGCATNAGSSDSFSRKWYECDLYGGLQYSTKTLKIDARYYFYTSPSDAFGTIEEAYLSAAYDDSDLLGKWAMNPTALVAVETGPHSADGNRNGTYVQLGVAPGFTMDVASVKDVEISFPATVGLSASNYYEGADGQNDFFGFATIGAKAAIPLTTDRSAGRWMLNTSVQCLFLGDATRTFNQNRDSVEVIGTVGVSLEF